ncbi:MAG: RidA family protein [Gammaproteobacteria bacterium]|nr:RidA family protein [Gammaproteobacteria bacterium]
MLPRQRFHPRGHFSIGIPLNHSHGIKCGELIFIGGQADLDDQARVSSPDNLQQQTRIAMESVGKVLAGLGADAADLVKLTAFYVLDEVADESAVLETMASFFSDQQAPGPALTLVPIETHCINGLSIEIEAIAMRGQNGERLARSNAWIADGCRMPAVFSQALKCRQMIFTSAQTAEDEAGVILAEGDLAQQSRIVLDKLQRLLQGLGADLYDAVKANVFNVEPGQQEDWKAAALVRASHYREPGPAATGLSLRRMARDGLMLRYDVIAMRAEDGARLPRESAWPTGHWDWPVHLPYRHGLKVGDLVFLGGQVSLTSEGAVIDPGEVKPQTETAMINIQKVLAELGLDFEHMVKINAFYVGTRGEKDLHENASVRSRYYRDPGPATTGIPFPYLAYEDMLIEIDCIAMV